MIGSGRWIFHGGGLTKGSIWTDGWIWRSIDSAGIEFVHLVD